MTRNKIILGGFDTWIEIRDSCTILLFAFETAKHAMFIDVMGAIGYKYIPNGYMLTEQERKELSNYINKNLVIPN